MTIVVYDKNSFLFKHANDVELENCEGFIFDTNGSLEQLQMANFVVILDTPTNRFRVIKCRMYIPEHGHDFIRSMSEFGHYMEMFASYYDEDDGE